jgi:hypothetical protein
MSQLIEAVNKDFQKLVAEYDTPGRSSRILQETLSKRMQEEGCTFAAGPMPIFIKPYFIDAARREEVIRTTETSVRVMDKVTELYFSNPETRPWFHLSEAEAALSEIPHGYPGRVRITRNDAFMTDEYLRYVEFNADSPGGPMYSDVQGRLTEETTVFQALAKLYTIKRDHIMPQVLKTLLETYKAWGGTKAKPTIVLCGGKGGTLPEFLAIVAWLKSLGYTSTYCEPKEWSYDGHTLATPDGITPDIIYRRGWIGDWSYVMNDIKPILQALRDRKVCMANPLDSVIASAKSLLALIQEPQITKILDDEEKAFVRNNIPWTRVVKEGKTTDWTGATVNMSEFLHKNRETLVLKPIDQYGGKDVAVGRAVSASEWDGWVGKALTGKFVVQQYVDIPTEDLPVLDETGQKIVFKSKKINVNFYAYGGVYTGGVVRSSDSFVINVHKGGGMTPIMFVYGKKEKAAAGKKKAGAAKKPAKKTAAPKKAAKKPAAKKPAGKKPAAKKGKK